MSRPAVPRLLAPLAILVWLGGGAAAITLISVEQEIEIGREAQKQVREEVPELREAAVGRYIEGVGERLAAHAPGAEYPYSFTIANYRDINAFALPGGPVWVNRGLIQAAGTEAQLAAVIGHEIAHIAQRHVAQQLTQRMIASGALGLLGAIIGDAGTGARAAQIGAQVLATGYLLRFSRDDEREADRVGAEIMHRAGWDPRGAVEFMQFLREQQGRDPSSVEMFFSSHPSPEDRVGRLQEIAAGLGTGRRDSEQFQQTRRRLEQLPQAPQMPRQ